MDKLRNECKEVSKKSIFDPSLTFPEVNRVDRTVKRKLLSVSDRRKLDAEKDRVVQAYRLLKAANKHKNQKNKIK